MSATTEAAAPFAFTAENLALAKKHIAKYPEGRQASAVLPLLDLAQRQNDNYLSQEAIRHVASMLDMPFIRVWEVATFYTMFNLVPVGKHFLQLCRTTPCWLRGSDALEKVIRDKLGIRSGETTADGQFSLLEVECLGGCVNAPVVQINDDYYEDLTPESFEAVLDALARGEKPPHGPQVKRLNSAPEGDRTTLLEEAGEG
ncbi:NADH-quinone oxidoreductase subunit NuoE [Oceanibacterium hippocampi]|uniref:NADH-quinone oxidoreductase chain 2 n=1 Tax=Oceanibacterium hippocampi TaxID=745714 RepID=A0A1Y5T1W2_9PROT|nr:NADH-quinone oxidoreductase subunit NuoE [Oceanibacterium hippocampi]SLN53519.1 NADH-quinone oxidoreductase chain 2 [Oceanibacterium hippocampi]